MPMPTCVALSCLLIAGGHGKPSLPPAPRLQDPVVEADHITFEQVIVPMVFPVAGKCSWSDTFLAPRTGHRHHGQDLMGAKMVPLVDCFDGTVKLGRPRSPGGHMWITLKGDNGWTAQYYHVNNDTPGTDDGAGLDAHAFAPGLQDGDHVSAGQHIGYLGDSGNAEATAPHLHFELWERASNACVNATPSLKSAVRGGGPQAGRRKAPEAHAGLVRSVMEGTVVRTDPARNRVLVRTECVTSPGSEPDLTPREVWVTLATDALVVAMEDDGVKMELADVLEGCSVRLDLRAKAGMAPWATRVAYMLR